MENALGAPPATSLLILENALGDPGLAGMLPPGALAVEVGSFFGLPMFAKALEWNVPPPPTLYGAVAFDGQCETAHAYDRAPGLVGGLLFGEPGVLEEGLESVLALFFF